MTSRVSRHLIVTNSIFCSAMVYSKPHLLTELTLNTKENDKHSPCHK